MIHLLKYEVVCSSSAAAPAGAAHVRAQAGCGGDHQKAIGGDEANRGLPRGLLV